MPEQTILTSEQLDQILGDLQGFGLTQTEDVVSLVMNGKTLNLKLSNITPEDEIESLVKTQDFQAFGWVNKVRSYILSRSITWINGVDVSKNPYAKNPKTGEDQPIREVLHSMLDGFSQEVVYALWKVYWVHIQKVEEKLWAQLPDSQVLTAVEQRFMDRMQRELDLASGAAALTVLESATEGMASPEQTGD